MVRSVYEASTPTVNAIDARDDARPRNPPASTSVARDPPAANAAPVAGTLPTNV
jgi:hypothetical protein